MSTEAEEFLARSPATEVLRELTKIYPDVPPMMIVGATCRDALHAAYGNHGRLRYSDDIDIALAVEDWQHYQELVSRLRRVESSTSGIRFRVGPMPVDLMPFGPNIEVPDGAVSPAPRNEPMSVFGFQDVWDAATTVAIEGIEARLPSTAGYTVLKLRAWLDRAPNGQHKDGPDIACALHWYVNDPAVEERVWETAEGLRHYEEADYDVPVAAVRLLVADALGILSPTRRASLVAGWKAQPDDATLAANLHNPDLRGWPPLRHPMLLAYARAIRQAL